MRARAVCVDTLREIGSFVLTRRHNLQQHDGRTRSSRMGAQLERARFAKAKLRLDSGSARFFAIEPAARLGSIPQAENSARPDRNEPSRRLRLGSARFQFCWPPARLGSIRLSPGPWASLQVTISIGLGYVSSIG